MVKSGIVDESTLVRKQGYEFDREVLLRKKALVQILNYVGKNFLSAKVDIGG